MSKVDKVVATRSFENSVKLLKKKHKSDVLKELSEVIDDLINLKITTQKSNHPLKNAEGHRDLHIDGGKLILLYRYDDDTLYITLRLQDVVDHKQLSNYNKYNSPAHDYDPSAILSSTGTGNFFNWYDSLEEEEQWSVDDIADREGIPNYNEASKADLSWLKDQYYIAKER